MIQIGGQQSPSITSRLVLSCELPVCEAVLSCGLPVCEASSTILSLALRQLIAPLITPDIYYVGFSAT